MSRRKLFESPEPSSQMLGVGPAYVSVEGLRQHLAEFLLYAARPVVIFWYGGGWAKGDRTSYALGLLHAF